MIANLKVQTNKDEIDREIDLAEHLGIRTEIPKPIIEVFEIGFDVEDVTYYHLFQDDTIVIGIDNYYFEIEYDKEIHKQLKNKFNKT